MARLFWARALGTGLGHGPWARALGTGLGHGPWARALGTGLGHGLLSWVPIKLAFSPPPFPPLLVVITRSEMSTYPDHHGNPEEKANSCHPATTKRKNITSLQNTHTHTHTHEMCFALHTLGLTLAAGTL